MKRTKLVIALLSILFLSIIQPVAAGYYLVWSDSTGYSHEFEIGGTVNPSTGVMSAERVWAWSSPAYLEVGCWFNAPQSGGYFKVGVAWNSDYEMKTGIWATASMLIEYILRDPSNGAILERHTAFSKSIGQYDTMAGTEHLTTTTEKLFRYSLTQGKAYIVAVRVTWSGSLTWSLHDHTGAWGTSALVDVSQIVVRRV